MNYSFLFSYHKDKIRVWPWLWFLNLFGKAGDSFCFFSESYGEYFNHFHDYWQVVGRKSAMLEVIQRQKGLLVEGRSFNEIFVDYCKSKYPDRAVVVAFDISPDSASRTLGKLQGVDAKIFLEDVIFFVFNTREEAMKLHFAIPSSLCESLVVYDGQQVPAVTGFTGWRNI